MITNLPCRKISHNNKPSTTKTFLTIMMFLTFMYKFLWQ